MVFALRERLAQEGFGQAGVYRDHLPRRQVEAGAGGEVRGFGDGGGRDRDFEQGAAGVEVGQFVAQGFRRLALVEKPMLYLASEAITRSRGNICEPSTTLAGATALTRTLGAYSTAIRGRDG